MNDELSNIEEPMSGAKSLRIAIIRLTILCAIFAGILLGISGDWRWRWAWLYIACYFATSIATQLLISSELRSQRATALDQETQKGEKLVAVLALLGQFGVLVLAALDKRFDWSGWEIASIWGWIALALIEAGLLVGVWAMLANQHFEATVRIQEDRGHQVVTGGPYRFVRHPGYAGFILMAFATPVLFASLCAFGGSVLILAAMILRTSAEDRQLLAELDGYKEYAEETRFRLIPGIW